MRAGLVLILCGPKFELEPGWNLIERWVEPDNSRCIIISKSRQKQPKSYDKKMQKMQNCINPQKTQMNYSNEFFYKIAKKETEIIFLF